MASFQRFLRPTDGVVRDVPSSLGALPLGCSPSGDFLLPVADEEAFWIGLRSEGAGRRVGLDVDVVGRGPTDALSGRPWREDAAQSVSIAHRLVIAGIRRADGSSWVFSRSAAPPSPVSRSVRLVLFSNGNGVASSVAVVLTDYARFGRLTATSPPSPPDPDAGYKGWRLP